MGFVLQMFVVQRDFPHSYRVLLLRLIVSVAGTPPGPAGMSDGHCCHWGFPREKGRGTVEAGDVTWRHPGMSWCSPHFPLSQGSVRLPSSPGAGLGRC